MFGVGDDTLSTVVQGIAPQLQAVGLDPSIINKYFGTNPYIGANIKGSSLVPVPLDPNSIPVNEAGGLAGYSPGVPLSSIFPGESAADLQNYYGVTPSDLNGTTVPSGPAAFAGAQLSPGFQINPDTLVSYPNASGLNSTSSYLDSLNSSHNQGTGVGTFLKNLAGGAAIIGSLATGGTALAGGFAGAGGAGAAGGGSLLADTGGGITATDAVGGLGIPTELGADGLPLVGGAGGAGGGLAGLTPTELAIGGGGIGTAGSAGSILESGAGSVGGGIDNGTLIADGAGGLNNGTGNFLTTAGQIGQGAGGLSSLAQLGLAGANVVGSVLGANAANNAANIQAAAANNAVAAQQGEFSQIRTDLAPYRDLGTSAVSQLATATGTNPGGNPQTAQLTKPFTPADLTQTPGYQFTLQQGEQAVANGLSAQGTGFNNPTTGASGPAYKGAINYAEGLAGTTYNQQLQNYLSQNQQIYNMLAGQVSTGQSAAGMTANAGIASTTSANQFATSGAAAQAAGQVGAANAITGGVNNIGNLLLTNALLQNVGAGNTGIRTSGGLA